MPRSIAANKASCRARLALVIPGVVFCRFLGACQEEKPGGGRPQSARSAPRSSRSPTRRIRAAVGEIKPRYETNIGFRLPGKLAARLVDVGQMVQKGEIIARLDSTNEQTAVSIAEADIKAAQAELTDAAGQEQRQRDLLQRGFTAQAAYDTAARRLKLAQAKVESAQLAGRTPSSASATPTCAPRMPAS